MRDTAGPIEAFVPYDLLTWASEPDGSLRSSTTIEAVVLFCDISGYTTMTNNLVARGSEGFEALSTTNNSTMDTWIESIHHRGGQTAMFIGDAIVAVWRVSDPSAYNASVAAARAAGDAIRAVNQLDPITGESVQVKCGVGTGQIDIRVIDMQSDARQLVIDGLGLKAAVEACDATATTTQVRGTRSDQPPSHAPNEVDESLLAGFVNPVIGDRLAAGQFDWLGELRRLSVAVVGLPEATDAATLQDAVDHVVASIPDIEDHLVHITVDDKGAAVLVGFGTPIAHTDTAVRAISAAMRITEVLEKAGIAHSVGVSTGRAFCGPIGNRRRRTYSAMGTVLNLASRLMSQRDGLLIDRATAEAASSHYRLNEVRAAQLKGLPEPVEMGRPASVTVPIGSDEFTLVGRVEEREALHELLAADGASTVFMRGEAGVGKSTLARYAVDAAHERGMRVIIGTSDAPGGREPYGAWRNALGHSLEPGEFSSIVAQLADSGGQRRLPLLAALSEEIAPDQNLETELTGNVRSENVQSLFSLVLARLANAASVLIVLEDAHWFDSATWALLSSVAPLDFVRLLVTSRPTEDQSQAMTALLASEATQSLELGEMSSADIEDVIKARIGVAHVPAAVTERIAERGSANPLFAEQFVLGHLESGHLAIDADGTMTIESGFHEAHAVTETVESLMTSRIDLAPPSAQLTLKVASVIGRDFGVDMLADIHPLPDDVDVRSDTTELATRRLLRATDIPTERYEFWHALTRDVAYRLIPTDNRRSLHATVANWYEQSRGHIPSGVLAFHHVRAENWDRAAVHLQAAAESAAAEFSNAEASRYLDTLIDLATTDRVHAGELDVARWMRQRGDALMGLGDYPAARSVYLDALQRLDDPFPRSALGMIGGVMRRYPARFRTKRPDLTNHDDATARESAKAHQLMTQIVYFDEDLPAMLYGSLKALTEAERSGDASSLARTYATWSVVSSSSRLVGMSRRYNEWALDEAQRDGSAETIGYANLLQGVADYATGDWDHAEAGVQRAMAAYESIGATADADISYSVAGIMRLLQGDSVGSNELYQRMSDRRSPQADLWQKTAYVLNALMTDGPVDSRWIDDLLRLGRSRSVERGDAMYGLGVATLASARDPETLRRAFGYTAERVTAMPASNGFSGFGLFGIAATAHLVRDDHPSARKLARRSLRQLRLVGFQFPALKPLKYMTAAVLARSDRRRERLEAKAIAAGDKRGAGYIRPLIAYVNRIHQETTDRTETR